MSTLGIYYWVDLVAEDLQEKGINTSNINSIVTISNYDGKKCPWDTIQFFYHSNFTNEQILAEEYQLMDPYIYNTEFDAVSTFNKTVHALIEKGFKPDENLRIFVKKSDDLRVKPHNYDMKFYYVQIDGTNFLVSISESSFTEVYTHGSTL